MAYIYKGFAVMARSNIISLSSKNRMLSTCNKDLKNINKKFRSWLFASKTQEGFQKAVHSGADVIVLDLEDSVPAHMKDKMRNNYLNAIDEGVFYETNVFVRLNSDDSYEEMVKDIRLMTVNGVSGFMLSKLESVVSLKHIENLITAAESNINLPIGSIKLVPIIETPKAFFSVNDIAQGSSRNTALIIGSADFMSYCKGNSESNTFDALVSQVSIAAASANLLAIHGVCTYVDDYVATEELYRRMKDSGYSGTAALTPSQVILANNQFSSSPEEIDWAEMIVSTDGISTIQMSVQHSRQMVGPPHRSRALHIIHNKKDNSALQSRVLHGYIPSMSLLDTITTGISIESPLQITVTDFWKGVWESSFLTTNPYDTCDSNVKNLRGSTIPFLMLNLLAVGMSVSTFSETARVHLGCYNAIQILPVNLNDTLRNKYYIDNAYHKTDSDNKIKFTIVNSSHYLLNQNNKIVFSVAKRTMFGAMKITESETKENHFSPFESTLKKSILENSTVLPPHTNSFYFPVKSDDLLVHKDNKVFGKSETISLCKLFKITNAHHHNIIKYRKSELLVPGPVVIAGMISNGERDLGQVIYEEYHAQFNINKVNYEDQINTISYVVSANDIPGYPHLEQIALKHIGIKNSDIERINKIGFPIDLFENDLYKPADYEKICAEQCPLLHRKIACVAERTIIRMRPNNNI